MPSLSIQVILFQHSFKRADSQLHAKKEIYKNFLKLNGTKVKYQNYHIVVRKE